MATKNVSGGSSSETASSALKRLRKKMPAIHEGINRLLAEHGIADSQLAQLKFSPKTDQAGCGHWEWQCFDEDGHQVCRNVWVPEPC